MEMGFCEFFWMNEIRSFISGLENCVGGRGTLTSPTGAIYLFCCYRLTISVTTVCWVSLLCTALTCFVGVPEGLARTTVYSIDCGPSTVCRVEILLAETSMLVFLRAVMRVLMGVEVTSSWLVVMDVVPSGFCWTMVVLGVWGVTTLS